MKLVESVPWQADVVDAPPVRLDYDSIDPLADVDFTYVAARHDIDAGEPDYAGEVLAEADVFVHEQMGWTKELARLVQGVSNGSYSALKETLEQLEWQKQHTPGASAWNELLYRQLYESKARVVMPDYPNGHPKLDKIGLAVNGKKDTDATHRLFVDRDKFILASMCAKIVELRRMVPDIRTKSPLRVVMIFGVAHYAVHDALAAAAEDQGVESFSSRLLFQESADLATGRPEDAEELVRSKQQLVDYQNWLRTPED